MSKKTKKESSVQVPARRSAQRLKGLSQIPDMSKGADLVDFKKELAILSEYSKVQALPAYNTLCMVALEKNNLKAIDMIAEFRGPGHLFGRACKDDNLLVVNHLLPRMETPLPVIFLENLALGSSTKILTRLEEYYSPSDFGKALLFCVLGRRSMNDDVFEFLYARTDQNFIKYLKKITQKDKDPPDPIKKFRARLKLDQDRSLLKKATDKVKDEASPQKKKKVL